MSRRGADAAVGEVVGAVGDPVRDPVGDGVVLLLGAVGVPDVSLAVPRPVERDGDAPGEDAGGDVVQPASSRSPAASAGPVLRAAAGRTPSG